MIASWTGRLSKYVMSSAILKWLPSTKGMKAAYTISRCLTVGLKPEEILRVVREHTRSIVGADSWALARFNREKRFWDVTAVEVQSKRQAEFRGRFALDHSRLAPLLKFPNTPFLSHRGTEAGEQNLFFLVPMRSYILLPLVSQNRLVGALVFGHSTDNFLNRFDQNFMGLVADQVALALENAQLCEQTRKSGSMLNELFEAAEDRAVISVNREAVVVRFSTGAERMLGLSASEAVGRGIAEVVDSRELHMTLSEWGQKSLRLSWDGEIQIRLPDGKALQGKAHLRPLDYVDEFLLIIADVGPQAELEHQLKRLTVTDDLTGLYNRRDLFENLSREIKRADRSGRGCSLCFFDLDRFKEYNDAHGHLAGDQLLRSVGAIISQTIRVNIDRAFRYGGDEFVLLLPNTNRVEAQVLVDRLRRVVHEAFTGAISFSAGIAEYSPGMQSRDLIEAADRLMYLAKWNGRNCPKSEMAVR